jgi:hypothetical protein
VRKTNRRESAIRAIAEQREWINRCGGDMDGYVANYHGNHGRDVENAIAIYNADMGELLRLERELIALSKGGG